MGGVKSKVAANVCRAARAMATKSDGSDNLLRRIVKLCGLKSDRCKTKTKEQAWREWAKKNKKKLGEVFGIIGLDVLMIVAGLIGGVMGPEYRWIFWAFGMFCFVPIIYMLLQTFKDQMQDLNLKRKDTYGKMMSITVITWIAYPVVWALGEGAGMLEQTIEVLLYVILDVIAKTVFSFILLECGTVVCVTNHFLPMVSSCPIRG